MLYSKIGFLVSGVSNCPEHNVNQQVKYYIGVLNQLARVFSVTVRSAPKEMHPAFLSAASLPSPSHVMKARERREHGTQARRANNRYRARRCFCQSWCQPFCSYLIPSASRTTWELRSEKSWLQQQFFPFTIPSSSIHPTYCPPSPSQPVFWPVLLTCFLPMPQCVCFDFLFCFVFKWTSCRKQCCLMLRQQQPRTIKICSESWPLSQHRATRTLWALISLSSLNPSKASLLSPFDK